MDINKNINLFRREVEQAGARLIAVSKTQPPEIILEAYNSGQRIFGENKVQEMTAKAEALPGDIEWHMIGHLQTNKVRQIAHFVSLIHSVDSLKLLAEIDKQGKKVNRVISCLLQVHIAQEETKFGFDQAEIKQILSSMEWTALNSARIVGLMGMASLTEDQEKVRQEFHGLRILYENLKTQKLPDNVEMKELSMGMSSDYKIALEERTTLVRVGTAIFGARRSPTG